MCCFVLRKAYSLVEAQVITDVEKDIRRMAEYSIEKMHASKGSHQMGCIIKAQLAYANC